MGAVTKAWILPDSAAFTPALNQQKAALPFSLQGQPLTWSLKEGSGS